VCIAELSECRAREKGVDRDGFFYYCRRMEV